MPDADKIWLNRTIKFYYSKPTDFLAMEAKLLGFSALVGIAFWISRGEIDLRCGVEFATASAPLLEVS